MSRLNYLEVARRRNRRALYAVHVATWVMLTGLTALLLSNIF